MILSALSPLTVRGRLLLVAIGVEAIMLAVLVTNSLRLLDQAMTAQATAQAEQLHPVLEAALTGPLAQRDRATVQAIAEESRRSGGVRYVAVQDSAGRLVAASGWDAARRLPEPSAAFPRLDGEGGPRYDVRVPVVSHGQVLGTVQFGLDLAHIVDARRALATQGLLIALAELTLSAIVLALVGAWLTRGLSRLTRTSLLVAGGDLAPPAVPEGKDEVGRLGAAFNTMSHAIGERVRELMAAKEAAEESEHQQSVSEERLRMVLEGTLDGFWDWDVLSGHVTFSRRFSEMLGYEPEELPPGIETWELLLHPDDVAAFRQALDEHLDGRAPYYLTEHRLKTKSGDWMWVLARGRVLRRGEDGTPLRMAGTHTDISERKRDEEELRRLYTEMARNVETLRARNREFAQLADLTALLQACKRLTEANTVLASVLPECFPGIAGELHLGARTAGLVEVVASWGGGDAPPGRASFGADDCWGLRLHRLHESPPNDASLRCTHHAPRDGWAYACVPLAPQGAVTGVLSLRAEGVIPPATLQLARAVTDAVGLSLANIELRESLHQQSISDPLTGLYNRRFMQETLTREVLRSRRNGKPIGLFMIDIDHFKSINDTHGHEAGDAVLVALAKVLREGVRGSDIVARYGGEEFTLILPESTHEVTVQRAEDLRRAAAALRVNHLGRVLDPVTISIGVAEFPAHADDPEDLLRRADGALYAAKAAGRNLVAVAPDRGPQQPADVPAAARAEPEAS